VPNRASPANAVLEVLGFALFVRDDLGALRLVGAAPEWLSRLWPAVAAAGAELPAEASPFLENFLIDAGESWAARRRARSGPWVEHDGQGAEVQLEATALTADGQSVLLVERLGEDFEAKKSVLQKARETVIAYQRLNTEMQKKEILLHCIAEDMSAALANVITSLRLIEMEENPAKTRELLGLASRGTEAQQTLIHRVLDVFAEELQGFYGRHASADADLRAVTDRAFAAAAPLFSEKGVHLSAPKADASEMRIAADARHLERVLANLLENALQSTPAGHEVAVRFEDEPDSVLVRVEDGGAEIPPEASALLFSRFALSSLHPPAADLRLHFCRIAIENCHGEIGHAPRCGGGNCFWIRLPKRRAPR
jgi:signal transduction histidine kinase